MASESFDVSFSSCDSCSSLPKYEDTTVIETETSENRRFYQVGKYFFDDVNEAVQFCEAHSLPMKVISLDSFQSANRKQLNSIHYQVNRTNGQSKKEFAKTMLKEPAYQIYKEERKNRALAKRVMSQACYEEYKVTHPFQVTIPDMI